VHFIDLPKNFKEFQKRLGLVVAYIREYRGIKQEAATKATGVNFFETELGLRNITLKGVWQIGELLHIHPIMLTAFACCGDGEWTEEKMQKAVNEWKEENKAERKRQRREMKNKKEKDQNN
jgi:hypothetical protein